MGLDEAKIQGFLATKDVAVLATVQADGAPLAMPMWFLHGPAALRARVQENLAGFERRPIAPDGRRPAAVAVVLLPDDEGRACFLLTRRTATLRAHARQWALPGGRIDAGESSEDAALRELREEVGLVLDAGAVL